MSLLQERRGQPLNNERGLEILEAGIYAALVILAALVFLTPLGQKIANAWNQINTQVTVPAS